MRGGNARKKTQIKCKSLFLKLCFDAKFVDLLRIIASKQRTSKLLIKTINERNLCMYKNMNILKIF